MWRYFVSEAFPGIQEVEAKRARCLQTYSSTSLRGLTSLDQPTLRFAAEAVAILIMTIRATVITSIEKNNNPTHHEKKSSSASSGISGKCARFCSSSWAILRCKITLPKLETVFVIFIPVMVLDVKSLISNPT